MNFDENTLPTELRRGGLPPAIVPRIPDISRMHYTYYDYNIIGKPSCTWDSASTGSTKNISCLIKERKHWKQLQSATATYCVIQNTITNSSSTPRTAVIVYVKFELNQERHLRSYPSLLIGVQCYFHFSRSRQTMNNEKEGKKFKWKSIEQSAHRGLNPEKKKERN